MAAVVVQGLETVNLAERVTVIADLLAKVGVDEKGARIVAYLSQRPEGRSADFQRTLSLRQPEVSVATRQLRDLGWITWEGRRQGGKGRPVHYYRLLMPLPHLLDAIARERQEAVRADLTRIERLRGLVTPDAAPTPGGPA